MSRRLVDLELAVRRGGAPGPAVEEWSEMRSLCKREEERLVTLMEKTIKAYETLQGRMQCLLSVPRLARVRHQPAALPRSTT